MASIENFRLRVFRAVAEHLSFRRAAEELSLTQPAVTQQIQSLEQELRVSVFDRTGGHIALTAAGRLLLQRAKEMQRLAEETEAEIAALEGIQAGELNIGASTTIAQYMLPRLLRAFLSEHPRVRLKVNSGNTEEVVEQLVAGKIMLGLIEGPALRGDVKTEAFMEDEMVLIMAAGHEWAAQKSVAVEQLAGAPFLLRERGSGSRRVVEKALAEHGLKRKQLTVLMELDSTEAIVSAVEAGLGVGFVSRWAIGKAVRLGAVKTLPVEGLRILRKFSLVRVAGPEPEGLTGAFRRFLLENALRP